jgi:hypothetical protein
MRKIMTIQEMELFYNVKINDDSFISERTGKLLKRYKINTMDGNKWENGLSYRDMQIVLKRDKETLASFKSIIMANTKVSKWENYGDVNFWEYGMLVQKDLDRELSDCYRIITCNKDGDSELFHACELYVDISDTWFNDDLDKIAESMDCKVRDFKTESEKINFAIALVGYYNEANFNPNYSNDFNWDTDKAIFEWLQGYEVGDLVVEP